MSQMSLSADETGSAVVCSGDRGVCRRVDGIVIVRREQGRLALTMTFEPPRKKKRIYHRGAESAEVSQREK